MDDLGLVQRRVCLTDCRKQTFFSGHIAELFFHRELLAEPLAEVVPALCGGQTTFQ